MRVGLIPVRLLVFQIRPRIVFEPEGTRVSRVSRLVPLGVFYHIISSVTVPVSRGFYSVESHRHPFTFTHTH